MKTKTKELMAFIIAKLVIWALALCSIPFTLFMSVMETINIDEKEDNNEQEDTNHGYTKKKS